jgi:hypothetical protein
MRYAVYFIVIVLLAGIQLGLQSAFNSHVGFASVLMIFVLALAVIQEEPNFYMPAFIAGIFADLTCGLFIGSFTIPLLGLASLGHLVFQRVIFYKFNWKHLPFLAILAQLFVYGWIAFYYWLLPYLHILPPHFAEPHIRNIILSDSLYLLIWIYPVYASTLLIEQLLTDYEARQRRI